MSGDKYTDKYSEEDLVHMARDNCFVCGKKAEDVKAHLIEDHFKGSIDDEMAKWFMDLDKDVDEVWEYSGTKGATAHSKKRGRRY